MRGAILILPLLALAGLTACQRPATRTQQGATTVPITQAPDAGLGTQRAPGLWEQRVSDGQTVQVLRMCLDAATDRQMGLAGRSLNENQCSRHEVTRGPDGWRIATTCDMGVAGQVTSTGIATGDFSRRYQIRFDSETTGATDTRFNGRSRLVVDATWRGPCPTGMAPGQMEAPPGGERVAIAERLPPTVAGVPTQPTAGTPASPPVLRR